VSEEQAVIVHFAYGSTDLKPLFALEAQLEEVLEKTGTGELDGNEVAVDGSDAYLYLYGPDAEALFEAVRPMLLAAPFMKRATVTKVYGELGSDVRREEVQLAL
jgi:hypothetical protein